MAQRAAHRSMQDAVLRQQARLGASRLVRPIVNLLALGCLAPSASRSSLPDVLVWVEWRRRRVAPPQPPPLHCIAPAHTHIATGAGLIHIHARRSNLHGALPPPNLHYLSACLPPGRRPGVRLAGQETAGGAE